MGLKFEWEDQKAESNQKKHGVSFEEAKLAFLDKNAVIAVDESHSKYETRYHCYGVVDGGVMTVRFTYRNDKIRIFGAAYWRKGVKIYEKRNNL
mgnify:FL=1